MGILCLAGQAAGLSSGSETADVLCGASAKQTRILHRIHPGGESYVRERIAAMRFYARG